MKKWWLLLVVLLAGCWDVKESERMLYIHGLGVDFEDGEFVIYAQIIDFMNIAKSEQPNSPDAIQAEIGRASGETPSEAFFKLYQATDLPLNWGHFAYMVFSEDLLKEGQANAVINTFIRYHDTRYTTWLYSTKENVGEVMLATPIINRAISISNLSDPLASYGQDSFIEPMNFRRLLIQLNEPGYEVKIPLVTLNKEDWKTVKETDTVTQVNGVSVYSPDGLKGFLEKDTADGLQWMSKKTILSGLTAELEGENKQKVSLVAEKLKIQVTPKVGTDITFDVVVRTQVTIRNFKGQVNVQEIKEAVKKQMEKEIRNTFKAGLAIDADVYRLSEYAYRDEFKAWKKLEENGKIPLTEQSLANIKVEITKVATGIKKLQEAVQ